jgi:hypothetical protein
MDVLVFSILSLHHGQDPGYNIGIFLSKCPPMEKTVIAPCPTSETA